MSPNKMEHGGKKKRCLTAASVGAKRQAATAGAGDGAVGNEVAATDVHFLSTDANGFDDTRSAGSSKRKRKEVDLLDGSDSFDSGVAVSQSDDHQSSSSTPPHAHHPPSDTENMADDRSSTPDSDVFPHFTKSQRKLILEKATVNNRFTIVAMQKEEAIRKKVQAEGLNMEHDFPLTLNSLGQANRREYEKNKRAKETKKRSHTGSGSDDDDDDSDAPEGEWEVEEIKDWGLDDDGKVKYLVQWKGWEGADTWEPAENLENAGSAVKQFLQLRQTQESKQIRRTLLELRLLVEKLMCDEGDVGILFKLFKYKPDYEQNMDKKVTELRQQLVKKTKLLREFKEEDGELTAEGVIDLVTKDLSLTNPFEAVKELLKLAEDRKEGSSKLKVYEAKLQKRIRDQGDRYTITMENLVDADLPKNFEYIKEYFYFDVVAPAEPVVWCTPPTGKEKNTCNKKGCMLDKGKCPCVKESGRVPYEKDGILKLDAREPIYECNSKCVCADTCRFRVVARGCDYTFCIFKTDGNGDTSRGWGLRAVERIPKGKFITTYNGDVVSYREKNRRDKTEEEWKTTYMFDLDYNPEENDAEILAVDARFRGNLARFINHSCRPNLQINPSWNENQDRRMPLIAFFTNRVINKGEELTIDYDARSGELAEQNEDLFQMIDPAEFGDPHNSTRRCHCGAPKCRGYIM